VAAISGMFLVSRLFHRRIRRRRWPSLVDFPGLAKAAREAREAIEAEQRLQQRAIDALRAEALGDEPEEGDS